MRWAVRLVTCHNLLSPPFGSAGSMVLVLGRVTVTVARQEPHNLDESGMMGSLMSNFRKWLTAACCRASHNGFRQVDAPRREPDSVIVSSRRRLLNPLAQCEWVAVRDLCSASDPTTPERVALRPPHSLTANEGLGCKQHHCELRW